MLQPVLQFATVGIFFLLEPVESRRGGAASSDVICYIPHPFLLEPAPKMLPPEFVFSRPSIFCYNHVFCCWNQHPKMLSPELVLRSLLDERLFATTLYLICWNQGFQLIQQGRQHRASFSTTFFVYERRQRALPSSTAATFDGEGKRGRATARCVTWRRGAAAMTCSGAFFRSGKRARATSAGKGAIQRLCGGASNDQGWTGPKFGPAQSAAPRFIIREKMGSHMSIMIEAKILEIFLLHQVESNQGGTTVG